MTKPAMAEPVGLSVIADALGAVPAPVQTSFLKAAGRLIGSAVGIPTAWLRRPAQAVEDTTAGRSIVAAALAKKVAEDATNDPAIMQVAADIYLPEVIRKARNRVMVARSAAEHLSGASTEGSHPAPPEDDWMNLFNRCAEDASSERLQDLFGRILSGQVVRPGAFGPATLRAVSELDQAIAEDFSLAWALSIGGAVDNTPLWQRGEYYSRWQRLSEAGLMQPSSTTQYMPEYQLMHGGVARWNIAVTNQGDVMMATFQPGAQSNWPHIGFTRVGREIGSLLPKPDYSANMRAVVGHLPKHGLTSIELWLVGHQPEVIWRAA